MYGDDLLILSLAVCVCVFMVCKTIKYGVDRLCKNSKKMRKYVKEVQSLSMQVRNLQDTVDLLNSTIREIKGSK